MPDSVMAIHLQPLIQRLLCINIFNYRMFFWKEDLVQELLRPTS
jgi:hypothetical protein